METLASHPRTVGVVGGEHSQCPSLHLATEQVGALRPKLLKLIEVNMDRGVVEVEPESESESESNTQSSAGAPLGSRLSVVALGRYTARPPSPRTEAAATSLVSLRGQTLGTTSLAVPAAAPALSVGSSIVVPPPRGVTPVPRRASRGAPTRPSPAATAVAPETGGVVERFWARGRSLVGAVGALFGSKRKVSNETGCKLVMRACRSRSLFG